MPSPDAAKKTGDPTPRCPYPFNSHHHQAKQSKHKEPTVDQLSKMSSETVRISDPALSGMLSVESPSMGPGVRECPWSKDFKSDCPRQSEPAVTSARDYLYRGVEKYPDHSCLGWRASAESAYEWWTYRQFGDFVKACRASIAALGLSHGDRIGIYARNCPQWTLVQYAAITGGYVPVPIYDTLGPNIIEYVCNHAAVKAVFVSADNFGKLEQVYSHQKIESVCKIVVIGHQDIVQDDQIDECVKKDQEKVVSMMEFIEQGNQLEKSSALEEPNLSLDDIFVIMYTSGTTGDPKGVVLTHNNFISSISSAISFFNKWGFDFEPNDAHLSYLPLAHIFEQQVQAIHISSGCKIGFYTGDIKALVSDLLALQPKKFIGVPRVYARFQQRIEEGVESGSFLKRTLFQWGYDRQLQAVQQPGTVARVGFWDSLVFNKVRDRLLPKTDMALTGAAPMSAQTNDFLNVCLNVPVSQGYGLTETVGGMCCSVPGKSISGNVGGLLPGAYVKLSDLPEMGYLSSDKPYPRGEICVKGEFVFKEYYNNVEATEAAFDEDGFFKTGDVGQWLSDGSLQIIDRAKNLFKLSQGEYVCPDLLEQEYAKCKLVLQIFVYGNSTQSNLVAVVVPDIPAVMAWAGKSKVEESDLEDIVKLESFKQALLKQLAEMNVEAKMKRYENIKDVIIDVSDLNDLGQGFHVDNNLMTPSFKLKRPQLKQKYGAQLDALYDQ